MKTPIALIVFNRPDTTQKVFNSIREAKPSKLFVIADGPRSNHPGELEKCLAARAVIDQVDWDCEVFKRYSDVNLGCALAPSQGISWVFDQVEEAIILEDDCVPSPSFFPYCEELLEKYCFDERVMHIAGNNPCYRKHSLAHSYAFSRYTLSWGWATWKRAWQYYDFSMKLWPEVCHSGFLEDVLLDKNAITSWKRILQIAYDKKIDAWDYQWTFTCWLQNGLSIIPETNLVTNIGFGVDATHTSTNSQYLDLSAEAINFPLKHPSCIMRDRQLDYLIERTVFDYNPPIQRKLLKKLRSLMMECQVQLGYQPQPEL
jgi:hypothetical protein